MGDRPELGEICNEREAIFIKVEQQIHSEYDMFISRRNLFIFMLGIKVEI